MLIAQLKHNATSLIGVATAWLAVITAHQEQVEWWFRLLSEGIAIVASGLTAAHVIKYWNRTKHNHGKNHRN